MKINKYVKDKNNKYKVYIDDDVYVLYDDIIAKYQLLYKKEIDGSDLNEIIKDNQELDGYYLSIKYISKKLRSEKEIKDYLIKKEFDEKVIKKTISKLKDNKILNDEIFVKCYVNDQINLSNNGPLKIKSNLIKLGINIDVIDDKITSISDEVWKTKISKYIDKKIATNRNASSYYLKNKIKIDLINLGYDRIFIDDLLSSISIDDSDVRKKEYEKIKRSLEKKYEGYELEMKIKEKMYRKGFKVSSYEE